MIPVFTTSGEFQVLNYGPDDIGIEVDLDDYISTPMRPWVHTLSNVYEWKYSGDGHNHVWKLGIKEGVQITPVPSATPTPWPDKQAAVVRFDNCPTITMTSDVVNDNSLGVIYIEHCKLSAWDVATEELCFIEVDLDEWSGYKAAYMLTDQCQYPVSLSEVEN